VSDAPVPLLTAADLAALLHTTPGAIQARASRNPDSLPKRAPGRTLLWHPDAYRVWAMGEAPVKRKVGRPRGEG
jgi:hypothetical protein